MRTPAYSVKRVEVIEPHCLKVFFADGSIKFCDLTPLLNERPYSPLKDIALFKTARVFVGTVVWSDEIDIAPEFLYEHGITSTEAASG
ncbi:MAG: DUF2442 domain-containing protein [Synergistaceae bacterium]|nr:DUF2442 domain-containing protein [Synergistaceae bacterium]